MSGVTTQKYLRVYDDENGVFIEVGCAVDGPEFGISIHTAGNHRNEEWFGKQCLTLGKKKYALALADAIREMAEQIEE